MSTFETVKNYLVNIDQNWVENTLIPKSVGKQPKLKLHITDFLKKKKPDIIKIKNGEELDKFLEVTMSPHIDIWLSDNNLYNDGINSIEPRHTRLIGPSQTLQTSQDEKITGKPRTEKEAAIITERNSVHTIEASGYASMSALILIPPAIMSAIIYFKPPYALWFVIALSFIMIFVAIPIYIQILSPINTSTILNTLGKHAELVIGHAILMVIFWSIFLFTLWKGKTLDKDGGLMQKLKVYLIYCITGPLILFPCKVFDHSPLSSIKEYFEEEGQHIGLAVAGSFSFFFILSLCMIVTIVFFFIYRLKEDRK